MNIKLSDSLLERVRSGQSMTLRQQVLLAMLLSLPAILAQLSNIIMEYIDASMVGSLGADASASIGIVSSSLWLIWGVCSSANAGFTVQVAQLVGARREADARAVVRQGLVMGLALSLSVGLVGMAISPMLPQWLGGTPDISPDASRYFCISAAALPVVQTSMLAAGMLRSSGNVITPSLLGVVACVLDVLFNFLLIFPSRTLSIPMLGHVFMPGAGLGVTGAAIGTLCADSVVCALMLFCLVRRSPVLRLDSEHGSFRPTRACFREAWRISLPMGVQHVVMTSAQVVSTLIVAPLGKLSIAANSFGITAESICYMPGYGIADAAQTLIGQSIGARRPELTRNFARVSLAIGISVMSLMGIFMYWAAPLMMSLLTPVEEVRLLGVEALRIEAFAEPMFAAAIVAYGIFVGAGDTLKPCVMNLASMWLVRLTLAAWLAPSMGLAGVWTAMCIELCFRGLIFLARVRWGHWLPADTPKA